VPQPKRKQLNILVYFFSARKSGAEILYGLQSAGLFGVKGNSYAVKSGRGMRFKFHGFFGPKPKDSYQLGAGFEFASGNYSLKSSKTAAYNEIALLGLMRWTM